MKTRWWRIATELYDICGKTFHTARLLRMMRRGFESFDSANEFSGTHPALLRPEGALVKPAHELAMSIIKLRVLCNFEMGPHLLPFQQGMVARSGLPSLPMFPNLEMVS